MSGLDDFLNSIEPAPGGSNLRRLDRSQKRSAERARSQDYKLKTSSMWTGMRVFAILVGCLVAFAYFTVLKQNVKIVWGIIGGIALMVLYSGWSFVSSDEGGAQLAGQVLGY